MLTVYNTKTHSLQEFKPIHENQVKMYGCGPTVYNMAHIGNLRAYVFYDLLYRYLKYKGFQVTYCMNLTDVDDKTIRDSQKSGKTLKEFTEYYTQIFFDDCAKLNILKPDIVVPATHEVDEMAQTVQLLLDKGYAYRAKSGDIFFKISQFKEYGQMAGIDMSRLKANADGRLADEYEKEDAQDFALWKAWKEEDGPNYWETILGKGRPGWHIECSSIGHKYLGQPFDVHVGGVDLIFPHHTNEIAQSECAYGCEFVRYWMHNEHITVNGQKMSKSLGNCFTLTQLLEKGYSPQAIRYEFIKAHYRLRMDFAEGHLKGNQTVLDKITDFLTRLEAIQNTGRGSGWSEVSEALQRAQNGFERAMDADLNTSQALACLFELMSQVNKNESVLSAADATQVIKKIKLFDTVLGIVPPKNERVLTPEQQELINQRQSYRLAKDWAQADALKKQLLEMGIEVKDTPTGPVVKFLN